MSANNRGPNGGISGLVSFPTIATGEWHMRVLVVGDDWDLALLDDTGRGDDLWGARIPGIASGVVVLTGVVSREAFPNPSAFNGAIGELVTVYYTQADGTKVKQTSQVRVHKRGMSFVEKDQENYQIKLTCQITELPTQSGWPGTQPSSGEDDFDDKVLWAGLGFTRDPNRLVEGATYRLRVWGTDDSNAAEVSEIESHFTQTAPASRMKLVGITSARGGPNVLFLDFAWALNDTKDTVINQATGKTLDVFHLVSEATTAEINGTPPTPTGDSFVAYSTTVKKLDPGNTLFVTNWKLLNSKEFIEFPSTWVDPDPSDLASTWSQTIVFPFGSPVPTSTVPAGQRLRTSKIIRLNEIESAVYYTGAKDSTKEEWEQQHSFTINDPNLLKSEANVAKVDVAPSTTLAGFTFRTMRIEAITHDHNGFVAEFGLRSTISDIEYPGSPKTTEVSHISDEAILTFNTTNAAPPTTPPVPVGSDGIALGQLLETKTVRENDGRWTHSFKYGNTTDFQHIAFPQSKFNNDPADIENHEEIAVPHDRLTPPPATPTPQNTLLKYRARHGFRVAGTPEKWLHVFEFDHNTTQDDIELAKTNTDRDPNHIDESARITQVTGNATPPSVPTAPLGSHNETITQALKAANGTYTGRWSHTFVYDSTTNLQKITNQGDVDRDIAFLDSEDVQTLFTTGPTAPNPPNARIQGTKVVRYVSRRIVGTPEGWQHQYHYAYWDSKDKIEAAGTFDRIDPNNIDSEAKRTIVATTQPADPPLPTGTKIVSRDNKPLPNGFNEYAFEAANLDSIDKRTLPKFKTGIDPNQLEDSAVRWRVWFTNQTPPANPTNPPTNNVKLIGTTDLTESPANGATPGTNIRVWLYGPRDSADELIVPKTRTSVDPSGLETSAIRAALDAAPAVDPVLTSLQLLPVNTITQPITIGLGVNRTLYIVEYALVTNKTKIEQAGTIAVSSPLLVYKKRTTTVVPVTGTAAAMASALLIAAGQIGDVTFERASVQLLNSQWARQTLEHTGEDKRIHSASWRTGLESMRAIATGGVGVPTCIVHYIAPGQVTGASFTTGTVVPVEVYRTRGRFLYRRRFITSTPASYDWPGSIGAVNAAAFLGYPAKTIMFGGSQRQYCDAIPGTPAHLLVVDYVFSYDSHFWVNFSTTPYGRVFTRAAIGGPPASGYVDPTIFDQNAKAEWPPVNDFSIFTA